MVNTSLNWASIVGIVLAVCGGGLYFLRSFKPELARDYDVFFSAIGLLCGGIFFFQGWRLDPIQQVGIFLLTGSTVFFAYESVRLRGVATDQARRSSYFDDEDNISDRPRNFRGRFNEDYERFEEAGRTSRRFKPQVDEFEEDYMDGESPRSRNVSRAIPASAVSRRRSSSREPNQFENEELTRRRKTPNFSNSNVPERNNFGDRRNSSRNEVKVGSRPRMNQKVSRQDNISTPSDSSPLRKKSTRSTIRQQTAKDQVEDASFKDTNSLKKPRQPRRSSSSESSTSKNQTGRYTVGTNKRKPRDNSSRFDD